MSHQRTHAGSTQRSICSSIFAAIVLGITTTHATASEARFIPLPPDFVPWEISGDGSVVAGWINSPPGCLSGCGNEAALWTEAGGVETLGFLRDGEDHSWALDVSADGTVIVGSSGFPREAFRWTRESGMVGLGDLPGGPVYSLASGVSGDGSVVMGMSLDRSDAWTAFRWTEESGMVGIGPGDEPNDGYGSSAWAASWNGSVIAGGSSNGLGEPGTPFRWTIETGLTDLGNVPGGSRYGWAPNQTLAMSVDGRLIVGSAQLIGGEWEPRQWTEAGGIEVLPNWESTFPWLNGEGPYQSQVEIADMSDDGTYVLGDYRVRDGPRDTNDDIVGSFIWDEEHGFRDLHDLLVNEYGLGTELANWTDEWTLYGAQGISYDGRRIVGYSFEQGCLGWRGGFVDRTCDQRGWLAILGPPYQPGDANRDEVFNSSDLVQVFQAGQYEDDVAGNSLWKDGDWTLDGEFTSSDLVAAFEAGGYEQGPQEAVNAVPEPSAAYLFAVGLCALAPISLFQA